MWQTTSAIGKFYLSHKNATDWLSRFEEDLQHGTFGMFSFWTYWLHQKILQMEWHGTWINDWYGFPSKNRSQLYDYGVTFFFFLTIKNICSRSLFFVWKMSDIYFREIIKKMSLMEKLNFLVSKKNQLDGFLEFGYKINKNP